MVSSVFYVGFCVVSSVSFSGGFQLVMSSVFCVGFFVCCVRRCLLMS